MTQAYIDVIAAHMRGEKIEFMWNISPGLWYPAPKPEWDFSKYEYRIAPPEPKVPDTIDWSHVSPEFKFMARNESGKAWIYNNAPRPVDGAWRVWRSIDFFLQAENFASYKRGTVEWHESLVERPQP